jgi:selenocysteine lyase/cysteine desulfurase
MDARTRLVSLSAVQFTTGFRADLGSIGGLCRSRGVLFCVDAIQALGIVPIDVRAGPIDFLSADAHKWLLGPEGVGIFYCREDLAEQLTPLLVGWKSVINDLEFEAPSFTLKRDALRFEEGSMNLMGIFALDASVRLLMEQGIGAIENEVLALGERVMEHVEQRGFRILTPRERHERAGIVTFTGSFTPQAVREGLRNKGIMVNVRSGGLRVSPHYYTTKQEIDRLFHELDSLS